MLRLSCCVLPVLAALTLVGCASFEFDNPIDPRGIHTGMPAAKQDSIAPIIALKGGDTMIVAVQGTFLDPGATATDDTDGDLTASLLTTGFVNTQQEGAYPITYTVFDKAGNSTSRQRIVVVTTVEDTIPPVITVNGRNPMELYRGDTYYELSATAHDNVSGNVSASITISGTVNTDSLGTYTIRYTAKDANGNQASATRTVIVGQRPAVVTDTIKPTLTLKGANPLTIAVNGSYVEPGATASDNHDGDIASRITISGTVNTAREGTYQVLYVVSDSAGNQASATRIVIVGTPVVTGDTIAPVLALKGDNPLRLTVGQSYSEPGATASDTKDGDLSSAILISGVVNTASAGTYTVTYTVTDAAGNRTTRTRSVIVSPPVVVDTVKPVIALKGAASVNLRVGQTWTDSGATASDNVDGDLTSSIVVTGTVNASAAGTYTLTYTVSDKAGNRSSVTRSVVVEPSDPSNLLVKYAVPSSAPLPTTQGQFTKISLEGTGPSVANLQQFNLDWQAGQYGGLHGFALQTKDGKPDWYVDLKSKVTQTFGQTKPGFTLTGSGFAGLDGQYYIAIVSDSVVWVRTDGSFAITFAK